MATIETTGIVPNVRSRVTYPFTLLETQRLIWLRGRIEAELFCAYKTNDHEPWLCDMPTAARLSFMRWQFVTGGISG